MSANTPLLTDASRLAATQNVENYSAGVATHINGDWAQHAQLSIINQSWVDSGGNTIPNSLRLRFLATVDGQEVAMVVPIIPFTTAGQGSGPVITQQPVNQSVVKGKSIIFTVQALGAPPLSYQWRYGTAEIPGAVSPQLAITNVQLANSGQYDCVVSNPFGIVTTNTVTLTVTSK